MKPYELEQAEVLEILAQRYHKSPAEILKEPAWLLRHVRLLTLAQADS